MTIRCGTDSSRAAAPENYWENEMEARGAKLSVTSKMVWVVRGFWYPETAVRGQEIAGLSKQRSEVKK
jgi:hypothetical protein